MQEQLSWRILFWLDAAVNLGMPIPVLLYPGRSARALAITFGAGYVPAKQPELMSDAAKQLVLLLWVCAGLVFVIGLMALAAAVSTLGNVLWFPSKWGEHPEYENSVGGFGGGMN
ncbi:hypothetical protein EMIHUDRAFT_243787 [Emiliania huxleyi CCMP1516]|uniref:Amino acid transporter transmembrane domain-containing protein n=2 Tax=Emiliania huxleyi TaxID=2903 RepID=A0A0D3IVP1_EMIH1|nr:hypothetical protein EMIHUDRAFT_211481 [Emiliania huxleyi CCMP1516]XP_005770956.1 hypothetical protein EMIHUDRAFT_243787 [Emiliania huxleyi CCMP1516]EOD15326.1 hypothetical protein EMIHUDRAFT_211481 [Emiliania huxleyi CCMP1516]EOD18527.1 hypothetical protein EMIHUDRAFT_243787 [Emiliania huxleyi CCMP1516]|eukprot:XP_005767755.1 hypothetical protein EMIHUDRAFT_211481 [Emiliania huxleyi CCMP1516]